MIPAYQPKPIKAPKIPAINGKGKGYQSRGPLLEAEIPGFTIGKGPGKGKGAAAAPTFKQDGTLFVRAQNQMVVGGAPAAAPAGAAAAAAAAAPRV